MAPMALTTLEAAQTVHLTTRQSCLNCHAGAAGGDGTKRGDLSQEIARPEHRDRYAHEHGGRRPDLRGLPQRDPGGRHRPPRARAWSGPAAERRGGAVYLREQRLPHGYAPRRLQQHDRLQQGQARPEGRLPDLPHPELRQGGRRHRGGTRLAGSAPLGGGLQRAWRLAAARRQGRPRRRESDPQLRLVRRHQRGLLPRRVARRCSDRTAGRRRGRELCRQLQCRRPGLRDRHAQRRRGQRPASAPSSIP